MLDTNSHFCFFIHEKKYYSKSCRFCIALLCCVVVSRWAGECGSKTSRRGCLWTTLSPPSPCLSHSAPSAPKTHLSSHLGACTLSWRATPPPADCGCSPCYWHVAGCCLRLTWTPRTSWGETGTQAACSDSLSPCTGSFIRRTRECKNTMSRLRGTPLLMASYEFKLRLLLLFLK